MATAKETAKVTEAAIVTAMIMTATPTTLH